MKILILTDDNEFYTFDQFMRDEIDENKIVSIKNIDPDGDSRVLEFLEQRIHDSGVFIPECYDLIYNHFNDIKRLKRVAKVCNHMKNNVLKK